MNHIFCFDLETTGLGEMGQPISPVQIAGVILNPHTYQEVPGAQFHRFMKIPPHAHVEKGAMDMHAKKGRTPEWFQANGDDPLVVYRDLLAFLAPYGNRIIPAGHNAAGYDFPILRREFKTFMGPNAPWPFDFHVMDTMSMALFDLKIANKKIQRVGLQHLCNYLGVPLNADEAHDALVDVRATVSCLQLLVQRAQSFN